MRSFKTFPPGGSLSICQTVTHLVTLKDPGLISSLIVLTTISESLQITGTAQLVVKRSLLWISQTQGQEKWYEPCTPSIKTACCLIGSIRVSCSPQLMSLHWLIHVWSEAWCLICRIQVPLTTETWSQWCKCPEVCLSSSTGTRVFLLIGKLCALSALP